MRVAFADEDVEAVPATNPMFAAAAASPSMHHESPETAVDERGIDTLLLAGIATSGVVLSTVRDAPRARARGRQRRP